MTNEEGSPPEPPWASPPSSPDRLPAAADPTAAEPSAAQPAAADPTAAEPSAAEPAPQSAAVPPFAQPAPPSAVATNAAIPLVPTSRLLAASFDLLARSGSDMRRASFYIGLIVLGTVGPLALASWGLLAIETERGFIPFEPDAGTSIEGLFAGLGLLAFAGLVVAWVESRTLAMSVLGGRMVERPVSTRRALARSRRMFWSAILASFLAGLPVLLVQGMVDSVAAPMFGFAVEASVITSTLVTAVVGGPFAYVLAGVVLGGVDPFEALRRSFQVFRARKVAAAIVVVFETITLLLVLFGIEAGLDVVIRVFEGLGLGPEAATIGLAATTIGVVAVTFAFGTLIFTVTSLTVAPQVVMFLGLTHATVGLDRVRSGGPDDPDIRLPGSPKFRWLTRSMLLAFVLGGLGLALTVSAITG